MNPPVSVDKFIKDMLGRQALEIAILQAQLADAQAENERLKQKDVEEK